MLKILFRLAAPLLFCAALCIPARAVSGSDALAVVRCLTALDAGAVVPRHAYFTSLHDLAGEVLDQALVLYFKAPASFTGEDTVEIHSHGSRAVIAAVLENLGRRIFQTRVL